MIIATNPRQELSEFYPPPYNFLGPRRPKIFNTGMGQTTSGQVSSGLSLASSGAAIGGLVAGGPIGGIVAAALSVTALIASMFKGCGSTCILTSNEVNQVEPYMQQNLSEYLAAPVSAATQQEAISNFNQLWQGVVNYCSQPSMGSAGKNCISDRQAGSCAYKTSPGGWQQTNGVWNYVYPGANGSGSTCWNWTIGYLDPIQNDPRVAAASGPTTSSATSTPVIGTGINFSNLAPFLIPVALVGGGLLLASVLGDM